MTQRQRYVTLSGLPLLIGLKWPYHQSQSGADWYVLHARVGLDDGSPLHAEVAINTSQSVKDALGSLDQTPEVESVVINTIRKAVDGKQVEFLKSGKLQPVPMSSRVYDIVHNRWMFKSATDEKLAELLKGKVYWSIVRGNDTKVRVIDPVEAQYVGSDLERVRKAALTIARQGWITLNGDLAEPTEQLTKASAEMEAALQNGLRQLEEKHAFEHG